jgi:hypothetical protein
LIIANFRRIEDHTVAKRYRYGQLRISRLHWVLAYFVLKICFATRESIEPHCNLKSELKGELVWK